MSANEFEALVAKAVLFLETSRFRGNYDATSDQCFHSYLSTRLAAKLSLADVDTAQIGTLSGMISVDQAENIMTYIASAEDMPEFYDALVERIAETLELGVKLHPRMAVWSAKILRGQIKRPTRRGRPPNKMRDILIRNALEEIAELTGQIGRSPTSDSICALDVVKAALAETGIATMDYENLKDIWERFQRERLEIDLS